jgi:hypothetical protein
MPLFPLEVTPKIQNAIIPLGSKAFQNQNAIFPNGSSFQKI